VYYVGPTPPGPGMVIGSAQGCLFRRATGGAGARLSRTIKKADIVAYEDLGTEAIRRIQVEDFPTIVVNDIYGNDLYEQGKRDTKKVKKIVLLVHLRHKYNVGNRVQRNFSLPCYTH